MTQAGGNTLLTMRSGRRTPMAAIPTPDLAVPYEAPRHVKTMAAVQPMAPKKGWDGG
jgi:hypothetical protein